MKRYLTACVLLACMLCSCSKGTAGETTATSAATSVSSSATAAATVSEMTEETTAAAALDMEEGCDRQLQIIYDNSDVWALTQENLGTEAEDVDLVPKGYTVTDLDRDGYLEIIVSFTLGEAWPYNIIYEVTPEEDLQLIYHYNDWSPIEDPDLEHYIGGSLFAMDSVRYTIDDDGNYWYIFGNRGYSGAAHHHERYFRFTIADNTVCNENICGYYFNEGEDSWSAGWSNTEVESITEEEYNEIYASEVEFDTENIVDIYWFSNVTQEDINLSYCTFEDSVG